MKKWCTTNLGLKLLSVLLAIGLWMIVVNVDDPVSTKIFRNISVEFLNESILTDAGQLYQVEEESDRVTVTVKAKRSVLESLESENFQATADFSERISTNAVPIKVVALKSEDKIIEITPQNNTVKISIDEKAEKEIPVKLQVTGTTADGYTVGTTSVSPKKITISGPQSLIAQVDYLQVVLDSSNASSDLETTQEGVLCAEDGTVISDTRIERSDHEFQATAKMLHTKNVDFNFNVEGTVADGYRYMEMTYSPTTVTIAGEQNDLDRISTIVIPSSELNIDGAKEDIVKKVDISKYLPDHISIVNGEEKNITVTINISQLVSKQIAIPKSQIDVLNTPSGMDMDYVDQNDLQLTIKGLDEELGILTARDLRLSIDLKGLTEGIHELKTDMTLPDGISAVNAPTVQVELKSREDSSSGSNTSGVTSSAVGVN